MPRLAYAEPGTVAGVVGTGRGRMTGAGAILLRPAPPKGRYLEGRRSLGGSGL
jgi:hypothetical protein